jgi:RNA polymerase sigma-70 factor, ECF subfamily
MLLVAENQQLPVQEARAGNPDAWDRLFQRYQLPLYVYVFELVHHEQETLDIVQESFIGAARHLDRLHEDAKFGSWLFSIAHQKCIQFWRRHDRRKIFVEPDSDGLPEPDFPDESGGPLDLLIDKEQEEIFMALLDQLPWSQRSVLLLYFVENFSLDEIAVITEAPLGTVKSRMHHAKRALRRLVEESPL